jgi:hypothetical protein
MILTITFKDGTSLEITCKKISNYEVSKTTLTILVTSTISYNPEPIELDQVESYSISSGMFTYDGNPILLSGILSVLNLAVKGN